MELWRRGAFTFFMKLGDQHRRKRVIITQRPNSLADKQHEEKEGKGRVGRALPKNTVTGVK